MSSQKTLRRLLFLPVLAVLAGCKGAASNRVPGPVNVPSATTTPPALATSDPAPDPGNVPLPASPTPTAAGTGVEDATDDPVTAPIAGSATPTALGTDADLVAAMQGDPTFATRLYLKLPHDGNVFFSPASVRMALAMTFAGAKGNTATEMATTLALDPNPEKNHRGFALALKDFADGGSVSLPGADSSEKGELERRKQTLRVVNRLWGQKGFAFQPSFLSLLETTYAAPMVTLDFLAEAEKSRLTINSFIADQTERRITDLVPPGALNHRTRLVLTNASDGGRVSELPDAANEAKRLAKEQGRNRVVFSAPRLPA